MADNLALKLLVAGIIGAVIGAAAAGKYHFSTGPFGDYRPNSPYGRQPIDPDLAAGDVVEEPRWRVVVVPDWRDLRDLPDLPLPGPPRYRRPPQRAPSETMLCWQPYQEWNFAMTGRWVACQPARR
jgi:hypothetical protein